MCWHKWSKWVKESCGEVFTDATNTVRTGFWEKQRKTCEKCGKVKLRVEKT